MGLFSFAEKVGSVRERIRDLPGLIDAMPARRSAFWRFRKYVWHALVLLVEEPEIAAFAAAQWIAVLAVYALWAWGVPFTEMPSDLDWLQMLLFAAWSLACLAIVAVPVAFFTACIGMVHFLRQEGDRSTLWACMRRVAPRMGPLWSFTFIDVGFTAIQAIDRVPSRRSRSMASRLASEVLYYAWKLATVGMLPAILADRPLLEAAKESVDLVKSHLAESAMLRLGYEMAGWVLGGGTFLLSLALIQGNRADLPEVAGPGFWFWAPLVIAMGVVHLFLRPVYLIASCDLYHDYRGGPSRATSRSEPCSPRSVDTDPEAMRPSPPRT